MDDVDDSMDSRRSAEAANAAHRPVTIAGDVVTRPAPDNAATIHSLLRHLRSQGVAGAPEPLGCRDGVETLRLIEGESGGDGWYHQHTDQGLASAARLLRRVHDASATWTPPADARWVGVGIRTGDDEEQVLCHGDPGPWNFVWQDNEATGLIDWDYLHPGPRLDDVAYALRWFVPLRSDELALEWHHFPTVPDRRHRIEVFLDAYGDLPDFDVVEVVTARMQATMDLVRRLADAGQEPQRTWVAEGSLEDEAAEIAWVRGHRGELG